MYIPCPFELASERQRPAEEFKRIGGANYHADDGRRFLADPVASVCMYDEAGRALWQQLAGGANLLPF